MEKLIPFLMLISLLSVAHATTSDVAAPKPSQVAAGQPASPPENSNSQPIKSTGKVYIVYLGEKPHDDHARIVESHYDILANVVGSKEEARKLMLYNYKNSFSGFAAKITKDQAKKIATVPGVRKVWPDSFHKLQNTRSWTSLGLSSNHNASKNLLQETNMGDGIIVGVIDSGIWSESKAFSDEGLGPVPSRWKGNCTTEGKFDASKHCNKKVIGARSYTKGFTEMSRTITMLTDTAFENQDPSPLDENGHGTHVASTVAGSIANDDVNYYGLNLGRFRGGAPRARLAIYKACHQSGVCVSSDVVAAVDEAVQDGVDIIQVSAGSVYPFGLEVQKDGSFAMSTFHAVARGVPVVVAAGNDGPHSYSVSEVVPWTISVASSTVDRAFAIPITLGDNQTITGRGLVIGKGVGMSGLSFLDPMEGGSRRVGDDNKSRIKGNVVISFFFDNENTAGDSELTKEVADLGGLALIISRPNQDLGYQNYVESQSPKTSIPVVEVDYEAGNQIFEYIINSDTSGTPTTVMIGTTNVFEGKPLSTKVSSFSSRGPNTLNSEILKPDIAAPGSNIIAAVPPTYSPSDKGFGFMSGTSMAAPHISAIVALLKVKHPDWSPAAIRSALVTTALNSDSYKETQIFAEGSPAKLANPFDFGGGIVNPNSAAEPGLVYDMNKDDYLNYLCSQVDFPVPTFSNVTENHAFCRNRLISLLDLNLPSITIPNLKKSTTVTRTVTNVGPTDSVYQVTIKPPPGTKVSVEPNVLKFDSKIKKMSFKVMVTAIQEKINTGYAFGSLTWSDGKHFVRIPISAKTTIFPLY